MKIIFYCLITFIISLGILHADVNNQDQEMIIYDEITSPITAIIKNNYSVYLTEEGHVFYLWDDIYDDDNLFDRRSWSVGDIVRLRILEYGMKTAENLTTGERVYYADDFPSTNVTYIGRSPYGPILIDDVNYDKDFERVAFELNNGTNWTYFNNVLGHFVIPSKTLKQIYLKSRGDTVHVIMHNIDNKGNFISDKDVTDAQKLHGTYSLMNIDREGFRRIPVIPITEPNGYTSPY